MPLKLEKEKYELTEMYNSGMTVRQIAKSIGEYEQAVWNAINSVQKLEKRKPYQIDGTYFDSIDTVDKAYILGFIAADGCITKNNHGISYLTITLSSKDENILELIRKYTKAENPIKRYGAYNDVKSEQSRLTIMNQSIIDGLIANGIDYRKSLTMEKMLHNIKEPFKIDFIRGYFDGDGSVFDTVTSGTTVKQYVSFRGTEEFLLEMQAHLGVGLKAKPHLNNGIHQWRFGAVSDVKNFRDMIYHENMNDCYMERKYKKFPW